MADIELEQPVMYNIVLLFPQGGQKLDVARFLCHVLQMCWQTITGNSSQLWSHWELCMCFVKLSGIVKIYFKNITNFCTDLHFHKICAANLCFCHPFESALWQCLDHSITIQIIGIQQDEKNSQELFIITFRYKWIVGTGM